MTQSPQKPALDNANRVLDLGLVLRTPRTGRKNSGVVVRRHVGIGTVDLRIVKAGLDDRDLRVVRHQQTRHAAYRLEGMHMCADPVGEPLRPGRFRIGEVRGPEHCDEDLRLADFTGEPIHHNRNAVAGVVDEQLLAGRMRLTHCHRQPAFPGPVEFTEARVPVSIGMPVDVFLPNDRQRDVLALQIAMHRRPIGFRMPPVADLRTGAGEEPLFQRRIRHVGRQRPAQTSSLQSPYRQPHRRGRRPHTPRNLSDRDTRRFQPQNIAHLAHRKPLSRHSGLSFAKSKEQTLNRPTEITAPRATSSRISGRHHLGTGGRHHFGMGGRDHLGMAGDIERILQQGLQKCSPTWS
jgi:hypothetical protein